MAKEKKKRENEPKANKIDLNATFVNNKGKLETLKEWAYRNDFEDIEKYKPTTIEILRLVFD